MMILTKSTYYAACFITAATMRAHQVLAEGGGNLRSYNPTVRTDTRSTIRRLSPTAECTLLVSMKLQIDPTSVQDGDDDEQFECQLDSLETGGIDNLAYPLDISINQKKELKKMLDGNKIAPGKSKLSVAQAVWDGEKVKLPKNITLKDKVKKGATTSTGRRLAVVTGDKPSK
jgi:hypothetical protein